LYVRDPVGREREKGRLTRRGFVAGAAGGAATLAGADALAAFARPRPLAEGAFPCGVAAGSPGTHGITLWTKVAHSHEQSGLLSLEVARDRDFRHVVERCQVIAHGSADHTVNQRITGLRPGEEYFYRFSTPASDSGV
jgi:alkaline phosphatase D